MKNEPKYLLIKNEVKENIIKNVYPLDSKIPSEAKLTVKYNVSRNTVRQALSELVNEGYLTKKQGSGTYVCNEYDEELPELKTKTIGIVTTYLSDYIFPSIIRGIEEELSKFNYSLMISSTQNNVENEKESLEKMLEQNVDGLIIEPTKSNLFNPNLNYYSTILEKEIPLLMLHASYEEMDIPIIGLDDVKAGEMATDYLIKKGHKKIAIITKSDDLQGKKRLKGYINALRKEKLSFSKNYIITFDTETKERVRHNMLDVLKEDHAPTAFVCYNDQIALDVINLLNSIGKKVPEDISIVSHDDSFLSTTFPTLRLTSIAHPKEILGKEAAKWIMAAIENKTFSKESIFFSPKLIIRDSVKSVKSI